MHTNLWQGTKIRLRAIEPRDWEAFYQFDQETEGARLGWQINFPSSAEWSRQWTQEQASAQRKDDNVRLAIETLQGEVVGSLNTHGCDHRNGTFEYGIALGMQYWRKGYASEAITLLLHYMFGELRYQNVTWLFTPSTKRR